MERSSGAVTIKELDTLQELTDHGRSLAGTVVQGLDLAGGTIDLAALEVQGATFLGCRLDAAAAGDLVRRGAIVFPRLDGLPYDPYRTTLYRPDELVGEQDGRSLDLRIYTHYVEAGGRAPGILEALAQRIHDHAIDDALAEEIGDTDDKRLEQRIVGIMGGHGTRRDDPWYVATARTARALAAAGFTVVSGGGPGTMEAANLGAFAGRAPEAAFARALERLAQAPDVKDAGYQDRAREARELLGGGARSIAIPTWFYGHEPSNLFSTHIAKYFSNSLREDGLLAISLHGVVFAPGSAGTLQEIWQDNAQNHYVTFGHRSPMAFLGRERWSASGMFDAVRAEATRHRHMLVLSDDPDEIVRFVEAHPPEKAA